MKKPYLKKIKNVNGFVVWYVDGTWVRKNLDIDFNNWGEHYRFDFIPEKEFWIDTEYGERKESNYFIKYLLIENELMKKGVKWPAPNDRANEIVIKERQKEERVKKLLKKNKDELLKLIKKKFLKKYSGKIKIFLVRGWIVRSIFDHNFTAGGHDFVYDFIPKNEVWIDDALSPFERQFTLLHELHERLRMKKGEANYGAPFFSSEWASATSVDSAHKSACKIEVYCRNHSASLGKMLLKEIKNNEKFIGTK